MSHHPQSNFVHGYDPHVIGTPAYRARHISMLWTAQLWHEAVMVLAGGFAAGLLFCAIARDFLS